MDEATAKGQKIPGYHAAEFSGNFEMLVIAKGMCAAGWRHWPSKMIIAETTITTYSLVFRNGKSNGGATK